MYLTVIQTAKREGVSPRTIQRRCASDYYEKVRQVSGIGGRGLVYEIWFEDKENDTTNDKKIIKINEKSVVGQKRPTTSNDTTNDKQRQPTTQNNISTITEKSMTAELDLVQSKKFNQATENGRRIAIAWEAVIQKYESFLVDGRKNNLSITKIVDPRFREAILHKEILKDEQKIIGTISIKSLRRKMKQYRESGRDVSSLLSRRKGNSGRKRITADRIYQELRILAGHDHDLKITFIYEILEERYGKPLPISYGTAAKYVRDNVKNDEMLLSALSGKKTFKDRAKLHVNRLNDAYPNDIWQSDGHVFNFLVKSPFLKSKDLSIRQLIRPLIIIWLDVATEMITGYACSFSENFGVVVSSFRDGVEKYGIPDCVMYDNGPAFKNVMTMPEWFAQRRADTPQRRQARLMIEHGHYGIFRDIGIKKIILVTPGNPEAKKIEPMFGHIFGSFEKLQFTYLGENIQKRPEHMQMTNLKLLADHSDKIPTWDEFLIMLKAWINKYNNKEKEALQASPIQVYEDFGPFEIPSQEKLDHSLVGIIYKNVTRDGINVMGIPYEHPLFINHIGEKVQIRYDVRNLKSVKIASIKGEIWQDEAQSVLMGTYTDAEMSLEAIREAHKNNKIRKIVYSKTVNRGGDLRKMSVIDEAKLLEELPLEQMLIEQSNIQNKIKKKADIDDYLLSYNIDESIPEKKTDKPDIDKPGEIKEEKPIILISEKKKSSFNKLSIEIGIG